MEDLKPDWIARFESANRLRSVSVRSDEKVVSFDESYLNRDGGMYSMSLDLESLPSGWSVIGKLTDLREVRVAGLHEDCHLDLAVSLGSPLNEYPRVILEDGVVGSIKLNSQKPMQRVAVFGGDSLREIAIAGGRFVFDSHQSTIQRLVIEAGDVSASPSTLVLHGGSEHSPIPLESLTSAHVQIIDRTFVSIANGSSFGRLVGGGEAPCLVLSRAFGSGKLMDEAVSLEVRELSDLTIDSDHRTTVVVVKQLLENVTFENNCSVSLAAGATGSKARFKMPTDASRGPMLTAGERSTLLDISGSLTLRSARQAYLEGARTGFKLQVVPETDPSESSTDPAENCRDATVRGFEVPDGIGGLATLNLLSSANTLSPHTDNLPGANMTLFRRRGFSLLAQHSPSHLELRRRAETMRRMRELTREKGTSGAIRTKVGWCAQRLRHATTEGRVEKTALWFYRLLGYGERPLPALATWVALAAIVSILLVWTSGELQDPTSWEFSKAVWPVFLEHAGGPIGSLTSTGNPTFDESWLYLVRALIAVPLVVGALSLRNYVRQGK